MHGAGHADDLVGLQMPGNKADAVPCERLRQFGPHGFLKTILFMKGSAMWKICIILIGKSYQLLADLTTSTTSTVSTSLKI